MLVPGAAQLTRKMFPRQDLGGDDQEIAWEAAVNKSTNKAHIIRRPYTVQQIVNRRKTILMAQVYKDRKYFTSQRCPNQLHLHNL